MRQFLLCKKLYYEMRDHVCKKANETEDWHNINKNYDNYTFFHTDLHCDGGETYLWSQNQWQVTENGTIINGELHELNKYCIDQTDNVAITCFNKFPTPS